MILSPIRTTILADAGLSPQQTWAIVCGSDNECSIASLNRIQTHAPVSARGITSQARFPPAVNALSAHYVPQTIFPSGVCMSMPRLYAAVCSRC